MYFFFKYSEFQIMKERLSDPFTPIGLKEGTL